MSLAGRCAVCVCRCAVAAALVVLLVPVPSVAQAAVAIRATDAAPVVENGAALTEVLDAAEAGDVDLQSALAAVNQNEYSYDDSSAELADASNLPSSYYLTNTGDATSVKLQSPFGDCWAFGAVAALESSYLKHVHGHTDLASTADASSGSAVVSGLAKADAEIDLSEHTAAWYAFDPQSSGSQKGEGVDYVVATPETDYARYREQVAAYGKDNLENGRLDAGFSLGAVETMYAAGQGVVNEATTPYTYRTNGGSFATNAEFFLEEAAQEDWSLSESKNTRANERSDFSIEDIIHLPAPARVTNDGASVRWKGYDEDATAAIKQALVEDGAVAISYNADTSRPGEADNAEHLSSSWGQYNGDDKVSINHVATIVGWDDSFAKEDLGRDQHPEDNGAWLVKNNWGSDELYADYDRFGSLGITQDSAHTGFYWLSYEDHSIVEATAFKVSGTTYDNTYQYDYLGTSVITPGPVTSTVSIESANIFRAEGDEMLKAVSVHTQQPGSKARIQVYLLGESQTYPSAGARPAAEISETTFAFGGTHTLALSQGLRLSSGQRYAVVEKVTSGNDGKTYFPNLEIGYSDNYNETLSVYTAQAKCNSGETYVHCGNEWLTPQECASRWRLGENLVYGNAMIKAYTDRAASADKVDIAAAAVEIADGGKLTYNGREQFPDVDVKLDGKELVKDVDYRVVPDASVDYRNVGTKKLTLRGIGDYTGEQAVEFDIVKLPVFSDDDIEVRLSYSSIQYDGTRQVPALIVKVGTRAGAQSVQAKLYSTDYTITCYKRADFSRKSAAAITPIESDDYVLQLSIGGGNVSSAFTMRSGSLFSITRRPLASPKVSTQNMSIAGTGSSMLTYTLDERTQAQMKIQANPPNLLDFSDDGSGITVTSTVDSDHTVSVTLSLVAQPTDTKNYDPSDPATVTVTLTSQPAGAAELDALRQLAATAKGELDNIYRSSDGTDVPSNREWVAPQVYDTLKRAYDDAAAALDSKTKRSVESAYSALSALRQGEAFFGAAVKHKGLQLAKGQKGSATGSAGTVQVVGNGGASVTLVKAKSTGKNVSIGTVKVDGIAYKVTAVAAGAYKGRSVAKLTIGASVKTIGANAFASCKKLKAATLGTGVSKIGAKAFSGCKKLSAVTVKSASLKSSSAVKNFLAGSKVKRVKISGLSKKKKNAVKAAIKKHAGKKGLKFS